MKPRLEVLEDRIAPAEVNSPLLPAEAFPGYHGPVRAVPFDLTGDGKPDMVIVATGPGGSHLKVFDGATGRELLSLVAFENYHGDDAITPGQATSDGQQAIALTAIGPGTGCHTKVFDQGGRLLASGVPYPGYDGHQVQITAGYGLLEFDVPLAPGIDHHVEYVDGVLAASVIGPYDLVS